MAKPSSRRFGIHDHFLHRVVLNLTWAPGVIHKWYHCRSKCSPPNTQAPHVGEFQHHPLRCKWMKNCSSKQAWRLQNICSIAFLFEGSPQGAHLQMLCAVAPTTCINLKDSRGFCEVSQYTKKTQGLTHFANWIERFMSGLQSSKVILGFLVPCGSKPHWCSTISPSFQEMTWSAMFVFYRRCSTVQQTLLRKEIKTKMYFCCMHVIAYLQHCLLDLICTKSQDMLMKGVIILCRTCQHISTMSWNMTCGNYICLDL